MDSGVHTYVTNSFKYQGKVKAYYIHSAIISPFVGLRNIISPRPGSQGAIREAIRFVLKRLTEIPTRQWMYVCHSAWP